MALYCYKCEWCHNTAEEARPMKDAKKSGPVCPQCTGGSMSRDYKAEVGQARGELPDWTSINAGVTVGRVADANKFYSHLGVTFDKKTGNANVPGNMRNRFLKERGLVEL